MSQPPAPPLTIQAPPVPDPPLAPYPPRSDRPAPDLRWLRFAVPAAGVVAVVVVLAFVLGGGGSGGDGDGYVAQPIAIDVTVPSIVAWTETSLKLRSGDVVSVTATGQVSDDERKRPDRAFSPDGAPEPFSQNPGDVLLSANHGSLIGKIGGGTPFPLGKQATFTAGHAGTLFLGMNDGLFDDNGGSFQVHVSVHRP